VTVDNTKKDMDRSKSDGYPPDEAGAGARRIAPDRLAGIRANKARGALTTLGIIIGIVAVMVTMTAANGLQNRFRESFSSVAPT